MRAGFGDVFFLGNLGYAFFQICFVRYSGEPEIDTGQSMFRHGIGAYPAIDLAHIDTDSPIQII